MLNADEVMGLQLRPYQRGALDSMRSGIKEIGKTLAPEYGPEMPGEAVVRLFEYYQRLNEADGLEFVSVLVTDYVALKARVRHAAPRGDAK